MYEIVWITVVSPKCIESSLQVEYQCFGCSVNAAQKHSPSFQVICKLQKSGLLTKNLLRHNFCFGVQHLLLQIFKIFSYCYV